MNLKFWTWLSPQPSAQGTLTGSDGTAAPAVVGPCGTVTINVNVHCGSCRCRKPPAPKGKILARAVQEVDDMLEYQLDLTTAPPGAPDVASRELHLKVADADEQVIPLAKDAVNYNFKCNRGDAVAAFLVDVDADGNKSEPGATTAFVGADTIAPPAPGAPGVTLVNDNA